MIAFLENAIVFVAPLLVVITAIVTVHELGHFAAGRAFGVAIERFSIGFGRALVSWKDRGRRRVADRLGPTRRLCPFRT